MGLLYQKIHQCLAYADDLVIIFRSMRNLKEVVTRLGEKTRGTKYLSWTDQEFVKGQNLSIRTEREEIYKFEEVESFTYLGTGMIYTCKSETGTEIQTRLMSGNRGIYGLGKLLRSKNVFKKTKLRIRKTVLPSIVTYVSEVWTLNIAQRNRIRPWERIVLCKIYGGKSVNGM